jgi:Carboxypeptidase regulatory-like domain
MLRKFGLLILGMSLSLPALAAGRSGSISGYVRSAAGVPQMGAMVEVLGSAFDSVRLFTDEQGHYSVAGLLPGVYSIKVSAPSFLPALRERVGLRSGSRVVVNLTLSTLFDALQMGPVREGPDDDDWKWVLRSAANRPILRVLDDGSLAAATQGEKSGHALKGSVAFVAGSPSNGFGGASDVSTAFSLEKSIFSADILDFSGTVGYGSSSPAAALRLSYSHPMENGSTPQVALTMRRLPAPDGSLRNADMEALALTTSEHVAIGNMLEVQVGSELQAIQFMEQVTAFRPFGSADLHLSPNTVIEYAYATSEPDTRQEKGFDTAPADLSESGPRMSIAKFAPALERAHHQEVSVSRRVGKTNLQFATFFDRISDPALTGVGAISSDEGDALPDIYSGTFTYQGHNLDTNGMRMVLQRKIASDLVATLDYEYGGVLELEKPGTALANVRANTAVQARQSVAGKISGSLPCAKTRWIASYRWTSGQPLTPVDMFNAGPGEADPYLNIFFRQPIPGTGFLPAHIDALIDIRNLLAEGYVPVLGQDGRTVYLVQSARSVRGGLSFTF